MDGIKVSKPNGSLKKKISNIEAQPLNSYNRSLFASGCDHPVVCVLLCLLLSLSHELLLLLFLSHGELLQALLDALHGEPLLLGHDGVILLGLTKLVLVVGDVDVTVFDATSFFMQQVHRLNVRNRAPDDALLLRELTCLNGEQDLSHNLTLLLLDLLDALEALSLRQSL